MRSALRCLLVGLCSSCLTLLATGCGVPGASTERVDAREVPFGLLDPAPTGGAAAPGRPGPASGGDAAVAAAVLAARPPSTYLLDADGVLVAVPLERARQGSGASGGAGRLPLPPTGTAGPTAGDEQAAALAAVLLRRLAAGPTTEQREAGLSTVLEPGVPVALVDVVDGTARVALRQPDRDPAADRLPLATGQVVLTVTSAPGVEHVQLLRDGAPTAVPLPGGARSAAPVTALAYAVLLAATR